MANPNTAQICRTLGSLGFSETVVSNKYQSSILSKNVLRRWFHSKEDTGCLDEVFEADIFSGLCCMSC